MVGTVGRTPFENIVVSLHIAEFAHCLPEDGATGEVTWCPRVEETDAPSFREVLRTGSERPCRRAN